MICISAVQRYVNPDQRTSYQVDTNRRLGCRLLRLRLNGRAREDIGVNRLRSVRSKKKSRPGLLPKPVIERSPDARANRDAHPVKLPAASRKIDVTDAENPPLIGSEHTRFPAQKLTGKRRRSRRQTVIRAAPDADVTHPHRFSTPVPNFQLKVISDELASGDHPDLPLVRIAPGRCAGWRGKVGARQNSQFEAGCCGGRGLFQGQHQGRCHNSSEQASHDFCPCTHFSTAVPICPARGGASTRKPLRPSCVIGGAANRRERAGSASAGPPTRAA